MEIKKIEEIYICDEKNCNTKIKKGEKYCYKDKKKHCQHKYLSKKSFSHYWEDEWHLCFSLKHIRKCEFCDNSTAEILEIEFDDFVNYFNDNIDDALNIYKKIYFKYNKMWYTDKIAFKKLIDQKIKEWKNE